MVSDPNRGGQLWRVAHEPSIEVVLAGTRLARSRVACQLSTSARARPSAAIHVPFENFCDEASGLRCDCSEWLGVVLKDQLVAPCNSLNQVRLNAYAIVGDRRIGIGHIKRGHVEHAERKRQNRREICRDTKCLCHVDDIVQADILAEPQETTVGGPQSVLFDGESP